MTALTAPLKWHGGKSYLADKIVRLMPPRCKNPNAPVADDPGWLHYVEPFFGGGAVLFANDPEGISEVANDLNGALTNFWRALQEDYSFRLFERAVASTPFSEEEWLKASQFEQDSQWRETRWKQAARFFVHCRQSLSGRMDAFAAISRTRARRGMNEQVSAWLNVIEGLPAVHARLKRVLILNKPALDVIHSEDGPRTLFYLDPPYLHETRATTGEYEHEMSKEDHCRLLDALGGIKGRFLLSGYDNVHYDLAMKLYGWNRHDFDLPNNAAGGKNKRRMTECLWCNY
jgi:DNA adenine methylase